MTVTSIPVPRMIFRWKKMDKIMKQRTTTTKLSNFTTTMNSESQRRYLPHPPQYSKSENEAVNMDSAIFLHTSTFLRPSIMPTRCLVCSSFDVSSMNPNSDG